ncbi:MAG: MFS transporter [Treponema sp.]|nr:MFS transporter [Treponema sp.]
MPGKIIKFVKANPVAARYITDGSFIAFATTIAINNYYLFAMRLGADDYQLSLVQFLPQIFTMLVLIPGGLLMDSLRNKKRIVIITLAAVMLGYLFCSLSPFTGFYSIAFLLGSLSFAGAALALYNIAWQSFFPTVVDLTNRNYVLTLRTRIFLLISAVAPLLTGIVLAVIKSLEGKIIAHQLFFIVSIFVFLLAIFNFNKFRRSRPIVPKRISLAEMKGSCVSLLHNKPFLLFAAVALFFHATWHFDWTLYFISQVNYLHMNEFQLGLAPLGAAAIQLLTLRFWSRKNEKHGVVLPFTFGILGLSLCPAFMIVAVSLPPSLGPHLFVVLHIIAHIPFATITLNLFQCLLQVVDEENRSFSMSVFACLICLSNAVMPVAGIVLYRALGGDLNGLRYAFAIIFALRIVAAGLWLFRWRLTITKQDVLK